MKYYGVTEKYLGWIENFLSGRFQTVFNNGVCSFSAPVLSGVPQGSVLGPLLFIIYINDLQEVIKSSNMYTFADDTKIVSKISSEMDIKALQRDLDSIDRWSVINNMELNRDKFVLLIHRPVANTKNCKLLENLPFFNLNKTYHASNNLEINQSSHARDLGIIVDEGLNFKLHIDKLTTQCRQLCSWIFSIFNTRQKAPMLTIFNSIIRTKLEYCCQIFNPYLIQEINKIEQVQRVFTSRISGMNNFNYWDRLKKLGIMSLQRRRERAIILHVWKILNNFNPNSVNMEFKYHDRSAAIKAVVKSLPKLRGKILTIFDESFPVKSAKLWNILPSKLTTVTSFDSFKNNLDKFLMEISDEPPLPGYAHKTNNYLTNLCSMSKLTA